MQEFCGYKALDGTLHETEKSAKHADYRFKISELEKKFEGFDSIVERYRYELWRGGIHRRSDSPQYFDDMVQNTLLDILSRKEIVLGIYTNGEVLKNELDSLKKEYEDVEYPYKKHWWLKLKWW